VHQSPVQLQVQVVGDVLTGKDQASTVKGATRDIRSDEGQESPALEMSPLEIPIQPNPVAGGAQPITKLDVLDRRPRKTLGIESPDAEEDRSPYGAAPPQKIESSGFPVW